MLSTYTNAAGTLLKFYDLPSIDAPHAPLADALEVDEFSADITDECEYRAINGTIDESDTDMTGEQNHMSLFLSQVISSYVNSPNINFFKLVILQMCLFGSRLAGRNEIRIYNC